MARTSLTTNGLLGRYGSLFHVPGVPLVVIGGLIGRMPTSMLSIALPLVVVGQTRSYAAAGFVTAAYTIASGVAGPIRGRSVDRAGARAVLLLTGWVNATALILVLVAAKLTSHVLWVGLSAALVGLFTPPISPVMRVLWTRLGAEDMRAAGFAFESITIDFLYIVGPTLVAVLIAFAPAADALVVASVLVAAGSTVVSLAPITKGWRGGVRAAHWLGPLRSSSVRRVIPVTALIPGALTAVELGVIAFAAGHQAKAAAGILLSLQSVGSILGGVYWGSRRQPGSMRVQLALLLTGMGFGMAMLMLAGNLLMLGGLIVISGLVVAPAITVNYSLMDAVARPEEATEAFAWMNAAGMTGAAGAVALAGLCVTRLNDTGGFLLAAGIALAGALFSALVAPQLAPAEPAQDLPAP